MTKFGTVCAIAVGVGLSPAYGQSFSSWASASSDRPGLLPESGRGEPLPAVMRPGDSFLGMALPGATAPGDDAAARLSAPAVQRVAFIPAAVAASPEVVREPAPRRDDPSPAAALAAGFGLLAFIVRRRLARVG